MKKYIRLCSAVFALCLVFALLATLTVQANDYGDFTYLADDYSDSLTRSDGVEFLKATETFSFQFTLEDCLYRDEEVSVFAVTGFSPDDVLWVEYIYYYGGIYLRKGTETAFEYKIANFTPADSFALVNAYGSAPCYLPLDKDWLDGLYDGEAIQMDYTKITEEQSTYFEKYVYVFDENGALGAPIGCFLRSEFKDSWIYFLDYRLVSEISFDYSTAPPDDQPLATATVYLLDEIDLEIFKDCVDRLDDMESSFYETYGNPPINLEPDHKSSVIETVMLIILAVIFLFIPLAAMVLSIICLCRKNTTHSFWAVLLVLCVLIMLVFVALLLYIL
ncbi:MAG: hypothetical protein E7534_03080 [Ruminococcaceae bacterium]|nr:hypothetical protein [Oscillospiraceae bacterium]